MYVRLVSHVASLPSSSPKSPNKWNHIYHGIIAVVCGERRELYSLFNMKLNFYKKSGTGQESCALCRAISFALSTSQYLGNGRDDSDHTFTLHKFSHYETCISPPCPFFHLKFRDPLLFFFLFSCCGPQEKWVSIVQCSAPSQFDQQKRGLHEAGFHPQSQDNNFLFIKPNHGMEFLYLGVGKWIHVTY